MKILFCVFSLFVAFNHSLNAQSQVPHLYKAVLDLRHWDFEKNSYVNLDGKWEFYYAVFLSEKEIAKVQPKNYIEVPAASWDVQPYKGKNINGYGYASYYLRVLLPLHCPRLALKTIDQSTAYKLYVNQKLIGKVGKIGKTAQTHQASAQVGIFSFDANTSELAILIHISNFSHRKGGIWHSFQLGTERQMYQIREQSLVIVIFLCGSLLIMSIYHFLLYFIRPRDTSIFYFAILCFVVAWRVTTTGEVYLLNIIPNLSFEWKSKLEYLSTFLVGPFLASYLCILFPQEFPKKIVIAIHAYIWLFAGLTLLFPTVVFSYFIFPYYAFLVIVIIIFLYRLIQAIRHKRTGAWLFLSGITFLTVTVINDMLHSAVIINTYYITPIGFFVFFFSQASLLAIRSSNAFNKVEILTEELKVMNLNLENRVQNRTQELATVNEDLYLKNQKLAETNSVKDKLFSIIAHDFRAPLNSLKGVLELLRLEALSEKEIQEILIGMTDNVNYTANLLDNLLLWASSQLKGIEAQPNTLNLRSLVQENFDLLNPVARQKQIALEHQIPDALYVWADVNMVKLILRNLLVNAIKFTFKGGKVQVSAVVAGDICQIAVKDEGIGMDAKTQKSLFELGDTKIRQGTAKEKGTGLGLMLSKEFIEKNGGTIWVQSREGEGAVFTFSLPVYLENRKKTRAIGGDVPG